MTDAERARRAGELHDALNAAYPADNHDTLDDRMRVMMLTLSHEEDAPVPQLAVTSRPVPAERSWWRQLLAVLKGWRSA